ncbi:MAG: amino acid adenylation domain-containing protein, partial [bacterium]|nr:amino acid adenylation domain-containing protein [bacterium]
YGPTEATVDITYFDCTGDITRDIVPIGRPIHNTQIYILDKHGRIQPRGVPGELCIAGKSLANGYLNNPELTAERFVNYKLQATNYKQKTKKENEPEKGQQSKLPRTALQIKVFGSPEPFLQKGFWPPEAPVTDRIYYKTGDLARWLPDGNIEFLGRIDHQVKIRGMRVELGEIERSLLTHPEIKETVVLAREFKKGDKILCAYYVAEKLKHPPSAPGRRGAPRVRPSAQHTASDLKDFLSQYLPGYM